MIISKASKASDLKSNPQTVGLKLRSGQIAEANNQNLNAGTETNSPYELLTSDLGLRA